MLWEQLVTDGHVRARRLRRLQPWLIALGFVLIWAGVLVIQLGPVPAAEVSAAEIVGQRLAGLRSHAASQVAQLPPLDVDEAEASALLRRDELAAFVGAVQAQLAENGRLPEAWRPDPPAPPATGEATEDAEVVERPGVILREPGRREDLFNATWASGEVLFQRNRRTVVLAGLVNVGSPQSARPMRWMVMYRRIDGEWSHALLQAQNLFASVPEVPAIPLSAVVMPLRPFLPSAADDGNGDQQ